MWTKRPGRFLCAALLVCGTVACPPAIADLIPPECVVLYTPHSADSRRVAQHYVEARNIPPDHLIPIDVPVLNTIELDVYNDVVRKTVRQFLENKIWGHTVRCLVTSYDFPLRVAATHPTTAMLNRATELAKKRDRLLAELNRILDDFDPRAATTAPATQPNHRAAEHGVSDPDVDDAIRRYQQIRRNLFSPGGALVQSGDLQLRAKAGQLIQYAEGAVAWLALLEQVPDPPANMEQGLQSAQTIVAERQAQLRTLHERPLTDPGRDAIYDFTGELYGATQQLRLLDADVRSLRGEETIAALDNELALLWCDDYNRFAWQPNPALIGYTDNPNEPAPRPIAGRPPMIMVARLDGPNADLVIRMIDNAVAVEKKGLEGTVYIDARGVKHGDLYTVFDHDLLALAQLIQQHTDLNVVVDRHNKLFEPGQCPNAALYCGWHKPKRYTPAFEFVPGAIGVHISSFAFKSIKGGGPAFWGPGLLSDGVTATFGPTDEPFLRAFPSPGRFFGLLLTGKYSLAECFWYANPMTSWKMTLVGDPLYRPFARNPKLRVEDALPKDELPLPRIPPPPPAQDE